MSIRYEVYMYTSDLSYYDFIESYRVHGWNLLSDRYMQGTYRLDLGLTLTIL